MGEQELLQECQQHGTLRDVYTPNRPRTIAFIGGQKFDRDYTDAYLRTLRAKLPNVTVVTGTGRGAESYVAERATELGLTVEIPNRPDWLEPPVDVEQLMLGADVIVIVGGEKGARAAMALKVYKRTDSWRDEGKRRPLVKIAQVQGKEKAPANRGSVKAVSSS